MTDKPDLVSPWQPESSPQRLKILGKLAEELSECGAATARCIVQGIDEKEPVTGKVNRDWLQEEIADVIANITLVADHFRLDWPKINNRAARKMKNLRTWHGMLEL